MALDQRIAELHRMRASLATLAHACHGDHRPDCPILDGLAGDGVGLIPVVQAVIDRGDNPS